MFGLFERLFVFGERCSVPPLEVRDLVIRSKGVGLLGPVETGDSLRVGVDGLARAFQ